MQSAEGYCASSTRERTEAERRELLYPSISEPVFYLSSFDLSPTEIETLLSIQFTPSTVSDWLRPDLDRRNNPFQIGTGFERLGNIIAQGDEGRFLEETLWPAATAMLRMMKHESRLSRHDPVKQLLGEQPMSTHGVEVVRLAFATEQAKLRGRAFSTAASLRRPDMLQEIQAPPSSIAQVSFNHRNADVYTVYRFDAPEYARHPYGKKLDFSHISNTYEAQTAAAVMPRVVDALHPVLKCAGDFLR